MKKIFKALAISAATVALGGAIAMTAGCATGYNGTYTGSYSYTNAYGATYGVMVEVTVENNIITKVKDITNADLSKQGGYAKSWNSSTYQNEYEYKDSDIKWETVSPGWETYYQDAANSWLWTEKDADGKAIPSNPIPKPEDTYIGSYSWTDDTAKNYTSHTSWLLQQYVGWSVADINNLSVYTDYGYSLAEGSKTTFVPDSEISGEPYVKDFNADLNSSGLLISGATQGSGRVILAVQNALKNK